MVNWLTMSWWSETLDAFIKVVMGATVAMAVAWWGDGDDSNVLSRLGVSENSKLFSIMI